MREDPPPGSLSELEPDPIFDDEEDSSGRRRLIIIIIIILLLLLLFWPVDRGVLRRERSRARGERERLDKARPVGKADYTVIGGERIIDLGRKSRKAVPVGVRFRVKNVSNKPEILDYPMVTLTDDFGQEYFNNPKLIEDWYEREGRPSPWLKKVASGQSVDAMAILYVRRGTKTMHYLVGRDFVWITGRSKAYPVGEIETMGD